MPSYNRVILMGHLTRDPETKTVGDTSVTTFGIAVNKRFKGRDGEEKESVAFVDCELWGKRGEALSRYLHKGEPVHVDGELKFDQWEKDGEKRSKLSVRVESFEFVGGGGGKKEDEAPMARRVSPNNNYAGRPDDDVPF